MKTQSLNIFIGKKYCSKYEDWCKIVFFLHRGEDKVESTELLPSQEKICMSIDKNYFALLSVLHSLYHSVYIIRMRKSKQVSSRM